MIQHVKIRNHEFNDVLIQDLRNYFKYRKKSMFQKIFQPNLKNNNVSCYIKKLVVNFSFLDDRLFNRLATKKIIFQSKRNSHIKFNIANMAGISSERYFFHGFSFNDFIEDIIIENGGTLFKLKRYSEWYDILFKCLEIYHISGQEEFQIHTPINNSIVGRRTFIRFGANPKCIEASDKYDKIEVYLGIEGRESE